MKTSTKLFVKGAFVALLASILGLAAVILTSHPGPHVDSPLFPTVATAWKNLNPLPAAALLAFIGFVLSLVAPDVWPFAGSGTIFAFPILAVIEMLIYPTTHTMFPFEFAIYGIFALPGVCGGAAAWLIRTYVVHRPHD